MRERESDEGGSEKGKRACERGGEGEKRNSVQVCDKIKKRKKEAESEKGGRREYIATRDGWTRSEGRGERGERKVKERG